MKCICKYCGHKHDSSHLVFNFTPLLKEAGESMKPELRKKYETICNTLEKMSEGPAFFTEKQLTQNPDISITRGEFLNKVADALGQIDGYMEKFQTGEDITGDDIKAYVEGKRNMMRRITSREPLLRFCEDLTHPTTAATFAEVWNNKLELPDVILEMKVKTLKGEGDIKVRKVLDGANGVIASSRYCPYCNGEMSALSGAYPEIVLTVLGSPRASKSTTLAACVYQFIHNSSQNSLPVSWSFRKDDKDWKQFEERCLTPYANNRQVEPTQMSGYDVIPRFSVKVTIENLPGGPMEVVLTVVDLPGELMGKNGINEMLLKKYGQFYENVDAIWYCTDWSEVKQITSKAERAKMGYRDQEMISIGDMCTTMNDLSSIFGGRDIPVAFILGKSDFLKDGYQEEYGVCRGSWNKSLSGFEDRRGYYKNYGTELVLDGKAVFHYMEGVRGVLMKTANHLDNQIRMKFPFHAYIAMSGYGHGFEVNEDGKALTEPLPLDPWNTEMPFLWTMAMLGYIRVQEVVVRKRLLRKDDIGEDYYKATKDLITRRNLGMNGSGRNPAYQEHYIKRSGT